MKRSSPPRSEASLMSASAAICLTERRFGEAERGEIFSRAAEYLRLNTDARNNSAWGAGCSRSCVSPAAARRHSSAPRASSGLDGLLARAFSRRICWRVPRGISLSENPDRAAEAALYNARRPAHASPHGNAPPVQHARHDRRERAARRLRGSMSKAGGKGRI